MSERDSICALPEKLPTEIVSRFWALVERGEESECWPWVGFRTDRGYGMFSGFRGLIRTTRAPRLAWIITHCQLIPSHLYACHECDNPPCCNPSHIFLGTHVDNMRDSLHKGRAACQKPGGIPEARLGERNPSAKLTADQVRELRRLRDTKTYAELAEMFGISNGAVWFILTRKTWANIGDA